jgi:hypothetical protein
VNSNIKFKKFKFSFIAAAIAQSVQWLGWGLASWRMVVQSKMFLFALAARWLWYLSAFRPLGARVFKRGEAARA